MRKNEIYVKLLEAGETLAPCNGKYLASDVFLIEKNDYFDPDDATAIWEFFPGDTVKTEIKDNISIAKTLVSSTLLDRKLYKIIFQIVKNSGHINIFQLEEQRNELIALFEKNNIPQLGHPIVRVWIINNLETK